MTKKKNNNNNNNNAQNENKETNNNNKEDETKATKVVMKVDMHCEGCSSKIVKCIYGFEALNLNLLIEGVEKLDKGDGTGKLTVTGTIDAAKLRDKIVSKTKKNVEVISPVLKNNDKENKKSDTKNNKPDEKKPKELPFTTTTLKMELHCQGCIERIRKTVSKAKGVNHVMIDKEKETVTVKGTMDAKMLMENLKKRFKRKVEVVQPKKEKDKENEKEGNKGEKSENDGEKKKNNNQKGGEGGNKKGDGNGGDNSAKMEVSTSGYGYGYGFLGLDYGYNNNYGQVQMMQMQAPQMFSDENPNACSIM